jgi:hypothetical protein
MNDVLFEERNIAFSFACLLALPGLGAAYTLFFLPF